MYVCVYVHTHMHTDTHRPEHGAHLVQGLGENRPALGVKLGLRQRVQVVLELGSHLCMMPSLTCLMQSLTRMMQSLVTRMQVVLALGTHLFLRRRGRHKRAPVL